MKCASCTAAIDHCHGTLVVHPDGGSPDCTEPGCTDTDRVRHALIIDCDLVGSCACAAGPDPVLSQAS